MADIPTTFPGTADDFVTYEQVCRTLFATGLYLRRMAATGEYVFRPRDLALKHKALIEQLRPYRDYLLQRIESRLAIDVRTQCHEMDLCTHCGETIVWLDMDGLKQRGRHRTQQETHCPGSGKVA